ncbi:hypothetical protein MHD_11235 [Mannheimia granulomatis]|uniref:Uncharacterized protein n=1 Tax=Mannheimia granulomatis TaxID=85402 RepID=A0A011MI17_9PAST|nr:HNH/endonuclease VII fold putative polymorphic toxin [Mannheimia granulomatis]EXI62121.1 hypothetical protein AK33_06685 [Mannheimia granulomatis]RGE47185.1 hypothetical protein MHD_11235 [Mannheimia granulomatis]
MVFKLLQILILNLALIFDGNNFDKTKLQSELDYQVKAITDFQTITMATINEKVASHAESKRAEAEQAKATGNIAKAQELENEAEKWETGGAYRQGVDAITNAVGLALGGSPNAGVVAGAISPYINTEIKKATQDNEAANLIAHAVWGAVEAYTQGGKAGAGAVAAVTGEVGANIIAQNLFGKEPENLTEAEKQTVSELSQVAAGLAGGLSSSSGDSLSIAQSVKTGQGIGKNAVENNAFLDSQVSELFKDLEKAEKEGGSLEEVFLKYKELSDKQLQNIQENCQSAWCRYGVEKDNEEANQKALELVGFFNSQLSTLSNSTQERFIEFVIAENAKEINLINGARTPLEKAVVFLVNNFIEDRENKGIKISPKIASFAEKNKSILDERPKNLSPDGARRQGAFNEAKRQSGIPTSQQPSRTYPNVDRRGNPQPGQIYEFDLPKEGGGVKKVIIRDDAKGHFFGEDNPQNRGPHFNDHKGGHYDY